MGRGCVESTMEIHTTVRSCYNTIDKRYRQTSNISHVLVGNNIVDQADVVRESPVGAAPTTSSF